MPAADYYYYGAPASGAEPPQRCGAGATVTIPPQVDHRIVNCGDGPLQVLVIYSPPLPPRDDVPIED